MFAIAIFSDTLRTLSLYLGDGHHRRRLAPKYRLTFLPSEITSLQRYAAFYGISVDQAKQEIECCAADVIQSYQYIHEAPPGFPLPIDLELVQDIKQQLPEIFEIR